MAGGVAEPPPSASRAQRAAANVYQADRASHKGTKRTLDCVAEGIAIEATPPTALLPTVARAMGTTGIAHVLWEARSTWLPRAVTATATSDCRLNAHRRRGPRPKSSRTSSMRP